MNKEYKLMTALIPIILILSMALYLFPDSSGITTQLEAPLQNQTNNTTTNLTTTNNLTTPNTQTDAQSSQSTNSNSGSSSNYNSNQGSYTNDNDDDSNSYTPTEPTTPTTDNSSYPA